MILAGKSTGALVSEYSAALALYPLWVIGHSTCGGYGVGHGDGQERTVKRLRAKTKTAWDASIVYWCERREGAMMVAEFFTEDTAHEPQSRCPISWADSVVRDFAKDLGVFLHTSDSLQQDATKVIAAVDAQLKAMQDAGELKSVNRSYREYRVQKTKLREPYIGYVTWFAQYRASLVRAAAQIIRAKKSDMRSDIENSATI